MKQHSTQILPASADDGDIASRQDVGSILREHWAAMRAYAVVLTGKNAFAAEEVLQESAIHVWEHRAELPQIRNMRSWTFRIVYFKALSYRREKARRPDLEFSPELMEQLAQTGAEFLDKHTGMLENLRECVGTLRESDRALLKLRYDEHRAFGEISSIIGKKENAIYQQIFRLHRILRRCVERKLSESQS